MVIYPYLSYLALRDLLPGASCVNHTLKCVQVRRFLFFGSVSIVTIEGWWEGGEGGCYK